MIELESSSQKYSGERNSVAAQIKKIRKVEKEKSYCSDRDASEYNLGLAGLDHFFNYVRDINGGNTVIDIGSGITKGVNQLSQLPITDGLSFIPTGLYRSQEVSENFGKIRLTSAEVLAGVPNDSVAGVLALNSIAYSASPYLAIRRIDQILVPGGVMKATFKAVNPVVPSKCGFGFKSHMEFSAALIELGYDVAVFSGSIERDVLLAKKPGGDSKLTAQKLLDRDLPPDREDPLLAYMKKDVQLPIDFKELFHELRGEMPRFGFKSILDVLMGNKRTQNYSSPKNEF